MNEQIASIPLIPADKAAVSELLIALGVDLSGTLAPSMVLGAMDVLMAVELAQTLPADAHFDGAIRELHTLSPEHEQPEPVRDAQMRVLVEVRSAFERGSPIHDLLRARLDNISVQIGIDQLQRE